VESHLGAAMCQLGIDRRVLLGEQRELFVCQTLDATRLMAPDVTSRL